MANTPKNLTPKAVPASRAIAAPAPTAQMPPQAVLADNPRLGPAQVAAESPPVPAAEGPTEDEIAAIAARRAGSMQKGELKMSVPKRAGWVRRWVNDDPGRLAYFQSKGWNFVKNPQTKENWSLTVDKAITEKGGRRGYVMEIPLQFYDEDQRVKQESLDVTDKAIYGGVLTGPDSQREVTEETPIKSVQIGLRRAAAEK